MVCRWREHSAVRFVEMNVFEHNGVLFFIEINGDKNNYREQQISEILEHTKSVSPKSSKEFFIVLYIKVVSFRMDIS